MLRAILGVIAGYIVWTVIWLGGNAVFFAEAAEVMERGDAYTEVGPLAGALVLSIVCSLLGGMTAGAIGKPRGWGSALILGLLLLITGIIVQAGAWDNMPLWYHLIFLVLLLPVTVLGARIAGPGPAAGE
ncbi:MAG: hypothetical protein GF355_16780 [Candidatus Eisenbacteria bacterium]|nr:hypothetical protein [Candidatus Eisenbacteria bacterium]